MITMSDYKSLFVTEFNRLKEQTQRLEHILNDIDEDNLDFIPDCPCYILEDQLVIMKDLLAVLRKRAKMERINLKEH